MNNEELVLFERFSTGITWNGIFYVVHKLLATSCTFLFFKMLPTATFSLWINSTSIIFLTVLWLDCGLRKTVPRYVQEFIATKRFTASLIKYYLVLLLLVLPPWYLVMKPWLTVYAPLAAILLVCESMGALLRLIFHSHFWHKQFNSMHAAVLFATTCAQMSIVMAFNQHNPFLLSALIISQICGSIAVLCLALGALPALFRSHVYPLEGNSTDDPATRKKLTREIATHAGIMWGTTIGKSITERNMLVPLFTTIFGAHHANIFKVGQDGALLLQRVVIKTIGTTDTSLLAHAYKKGEETLIHKVLKKITTKIATLCLPVSGILLVILAKRDLFFSDPTVFHIFYLIVSCYLIESSLSVYERVLEVKRAYRAIFAAYVPYVIVMGVCIFFNLFSSIGLIGSILVIQGVRLVSLLSMTYWACVLYNAPFSRVTLLTMLGGVIPLLFYYVMF